MEKFIPYAKLSKKARRQADRARRQTWAISPVTRRPQNPKAYKRKTGPIPQDDGTGLSLSTADMACAGRTLHTQPSSRMLPMPAARLTEEPASSWVRVWRPRRREE